MTTQLNPEVFYGQAFKPVLPSLLQRKCTSCGNRTAAGGECTECAKKKHNLQRKLSIGASNDPLEHEADRVADQVMSMQPNATVNKAPVRIQRYSGQPNQGEGTAPASVDHVLSSAGRPLEPTLRNNMEQRFGHDFSHVRVHTGGKAEQSAREVNANAYTVGNNVVFGAGQYAPQTQSGQRLLAHELTHVVQQRYIDATKVHRQEATDNRDSSKQWVMLTPPPIVQQQSLTCWAAALSSWLGALGTAVVSYQDIILRYAGKSCIEPDNSLPYATATEVYAEWGAKFTRFESSRDLTSEKVRSLLRTNGHLLIAQVGHNLGHVIVVYGSGFDESRAPNSEYISVMDPLLGTYQNRLLNGLSYPVHVGVAGKVVRPAGCLSKAGKDPEEPKSD